MIHKSFLPAFWELRRDAITEKIEDSEFQHLILWCCQDRPSDRPTMKQVVEKLKKMLNPLLTLQPEQCRAVELCSAAEAKIRKDNYEGAKQDVLKANQIDLNDAFTLKCRGRAKLLLKQNQEALEDLERADKLDANDSFTLRHLGAAKQQLGVHKEALDYLNRADEQEPFNVLTLKHRALAKYKLQDYVGALDDLALTLYINPTDEECKDLKGKILKEQNILQGISQHMNVMQANTQARTTKN